MNIQKHAFLVAAHAYPEILEQTIQKLQADNHYFFVHVDLKVKDLTPWQRIADSYKNVILVQNRLKVNWGGGSQILLTIKLLREPRQLLDFDYYHLISGQDIAILGAEEFDRHFVGKERSYMLYAKDCPKVDFRIRHYFTHDFINHLSKWALPIKVIERCVALIIWRPKLPMEIRMGSTWFSFHRKVVDYVLSYLDNHPEYIRRFRWTACADELFFHTLLYPQSDMLNICTENNLRYIVWPSSGSHPRVLITEDYAEIIKSDAVFARKVHPVVSEGLLSLMRQDTK